MQILFHRYFCIAMISIVILLPVGCGPRESSPFFKRNADDARVLAVEMASARERLLQDDLRGAFNGGSPKNVLVISGGDANGAYGCGLLRGWRDAPGGRPVFDVVTGVSTGALMATAIFLGELDDEESLRMIYTEVEDSDIFTGPFTFGKPNSLLKTGPLKKLLEKHITRELIHRVAIAHRSGRRLYVATVGLDQGRTIIWPLSRIAADADAESGEAGLQKYRNILLAATAIPFIFPPVEIDGELHADAGLREGLFLRSWMLGQDSQATSRGTVYALVNGKLHLKPEAVGDHLVHIGSRSLDIYNEALLIFNLREVAHTAITHSPTFMFKYNAIPDRIDDGPGPGLFSPMFNPKITRELYKEGQKSGQLAKWSINIPMLDDDMQPQPK